MNTMVTAKSYRAARRRAPPRGRLVRPRRGFRRPTPAPVQLDEHERRPAAAADRVIAFPPAGEMTVSAWLVGRAHL
ncbi:hypothetical protein V5P93_002946 [Actinokineospora auranticolor]|uniref:hypothetical protein n=1 Tax=Actinokineospora auranticolor TaxID=155976 RepID=UPI0011B0C03F|nr:hypothetical protein [Actinokineospora auranticolor]